MADKTQTDLLQEIQHLSERLQEQDRQLARFKAPPSRARLLSKSQGKPRPAAAPGLMSPEQLAWLARAIEALVPCRGGIVELDDAGLVRAVRGGACESLGVSGDDLIGMPWESWLALDDGSGG